MRRTFFDTLALAAVIVASVYLTWSQRAHADVVLPTPTANSTKVAPRLVVSGIQFDFVQRQTLVIYRIFGSDGKLVGEYRQGGPMPLAPAPYVTQARVAFEMALAGLTPVAGITPVGKGSVTP